MATTGEIASTATATTAAEAPWDDVDWSYLANHQTSNDFLLVSTFASLDEKSYVLYVKGFDLSSVPDGARIDGITVRIEASEYASDAEIGLVQLLDATGARAGDNKASTPVALTTTDVVYTFGGAADKWGNALTAAWVKGANFGVAIAATSKRSGTEAARIDYITLEVHYTVVPPTLYWVTYDSALAAPTGAQVRAGDDTNDDPADASGSEEAPTTTTEPFTFTTPITGLSGTGGFKTAVVWYSETLDEYSNVSVSGEWFLDGGGSLPTLTGIAAGSITATGATLTITAS